MFFRRYRQATLGCNGLTCHWIIICVKSNFWIFLCWVKWRGEETQLTFTFSKSTMFKVNKKNTRKHQNDVSDVIIVNFEHISHFFSSVSTVNFEQVNASWGITNSYLTAVQKEATNIAGNWPSKVLRALGKTRLRARFRGWRGDGGERPSLFCNHLFSFAITLKRYELGSSLINACKLSTMHH